MRKGQKGSNPEKAHHQRRLFKFEASVIKSIIIDECDYIWIMFDAYSIYFLSTNAVIDVNVPLRGCLAEYQSEVFKYKAFCNSEASIDVC